MNERTASESTHDLLLAMAGRVDDDMLGWARELVAVGEDARAVELLTASLIADRAGLPEPVHAALVAAGRAARVDLDAAVLPLAGSDEFTGHRFDAAPPGVPDVGAAVRALPARQLRDCRVQLTWRLTPAGSAPGPLPHPVVLVEVDPGGPPTDVLAYQLAVALDRAGAQASVEVLTSGRPLSAYHAAALRDAVPARTDSAGNSPDAVPAVDGPGRYERSRAYDAFATHEAGSDEPAGVADEEPVEEQDAAPAFPPGSDPLADPMPIASAEPADDEDDYPGGDYDRSFAEDPAPEYVEDLAEPPAPPSPEPVADNTATAMLPSRPQAEPVGSEQRQPTTPLRTTPAAGHRPPTDPPPPVPIRVVPDPGGRRRKPPPGDDVAGDPNPRPAPRPIPGRLPPSRRPTVTPISRTSVPSPIPLVRRDGTPPTARPLHPVPGDAGPPVGQPPVSLFGEPIPEQSPPARSESPALAGLDDPLNGPLNQPLMASLLEPTILDDDPLGVGDIDRADPETHAPEQADLERDEPEPEELETSDEPEPAEDEPHGDEIGDQLSDESSEEPVVDGQWANDWSSGSWAMAPSALGELATDDDGGEADQDFGRRRARHRSGAELAAEAGIDEAAAEPEVEVEAPPVLPPAPQPAADSRELGLRPESVARLSDADRELLARLQAELGQGRKPRVTRRAGVGQPNNGAPTNGSGPTNGHGSGPPDLAG